MKIAAATGNAIDTVRRLGTTGKQLRRSAVVRSASVTALLLAAVVAALVSAPAASAAEPLTVTLESVKITGSTSAELSGSVNAHEEEAKIYVESSRSANFSSPDYLLVLQIPSGTTGSVPVAGELTGLEPGTKYFFRLRAIIREGSGGETYSPEPYPTASTPAAAPRVFRQRDTGVAGDQATLTATVIPGGAETAYHFEYVPAANFEAEGWTSSAAVSTPVGGPLPADNAEHEVSTTAPGLIPGTRYRWRLVAENSIGRVDGNESYFTTTGAPVAASGGCPNEAFRLGPGALLPDCRAYELASPADKNGGSVEGFAGFFRTAPDGGAVTFYDAGGTTIPSPTGGAPSFSTYLAGRGSESWTTQRLMVPQSYADSKYSLWLGSTSNLRYAIVQGIRVGVGNGLFAIDKSGSVATIVPWEENPEIYSEGSPGFPYAFDGASEDGSRIFFESEAALTGVDGAREGVHNLYMWERATGQVTVVGLLPAAEGGAAPELGAFGGAYEWFNGEQTGSGGALDGLAVESSHAISSNGAQVFFTGAGTGQIYLRRGLDGASPTTVRVSEPASGAPAEAERPAAFQEATPSGSRAFFLSSQKLTSNATTGPSDEGKDLYRWDATSGELVDVTPDPEDPAGAEVDGLLGVSADGSSGYFAADGHLASGATAGRPNLYRFSEVGGTFRITFIALLSENTSRGVADYRNWSPRTYLLNHAIEPTESKTSRVTPDGQTLLFESTASLTGFDNTNPAPGVECNGSSNPACAEIYLYSATTGRITCVSCDPSGEPPLGSATLQGRNLVTFESPEYAPNVQVPRNLSSDGDRVFFQTPDPLVSRDGNGTYGCRYTNLSNNSQQFESEADRQCDDVYEWEAPGSPGGTCQKAETNGGCLYLLSTGQSGVASYFADASESGSEAFIITASALVPADRDTVYDVYDASTDGGMSSQWASPGLPCEGEACLGPPAPVSAAASPSSSRLEGPGNAKHKKKHHKKKHKKKKHKKLSARNHKRVTRQSDRRAVHFTRNGGSK